MSDLLQIQVGAEPWMPSSDVEELVVLDEYNIPLAGLISQHGVPFLYVCAAGEEELANVWLYAHLDEADVDLLRQARGREPLVRAMAACLRNRMVVAALASDFRTVSSAAFQTAEEKPGTMVRRYLHLEEARLRRRETELSALRRDPSLDEEDQELALC